MAKVITTQQDLEPMFRGADTLARAVAPNLGPNSRTAIVDQKYDIPLVVKEGKNIFTGFEVEDPVENIGTVLLRDSAMKTSFLTGDGTITTAVLENQLLKSGKILLSSGVNPMLLRKALDKYLPLVRSSILETALPVRSDEELKQYVFGASADRELADMVLEAICAVGLDGVIQVQDSQERKNRLEITDGIRYDYGWYSSAFINRPVQRDVYLENPYVLIVNRKIKTIEEIEKVLTQIIDVEIPILIICSDMESNVMNQVAENNRRRILSACVANAPGHGETRRKNLMALAQRTGAVMIDDSGIFDLSACGLEVCGRVNSAQVTKELTVLKGLQPGDQTMLGGMRKALERDLTGTADPNETDRFQTSLAIINGRMAILYAGGATDVEMFEKQHRAENMISAARSAKKLGVVPGGGRGFLNAVPVLRAQLRDDLPEAERACIRWLTEALQTPIRQLADNTGESGSYVLATVMEHLKEPYYGFNGEKRCCEDLSESNVWDAADTVVTAFEVAAQTAITLLTVSAAVLK